MKEMSQGSLAIGKVGVVVIGRNEGERLRVCLESVVGKADKIVYVDSGSADGSVEMACRLGVAVVELDMGKPFTAARARNTGFFHLHEIAPGLEYVQFVDGDCEVVAGWVHNAARFLDEHADAAVVCGRRRERFPDRSVYNMLCDIEWDTPVGMAKYCGGDALVRVSALQRVGGFRDSLIAGEEPELCVRLREAGWSVWRIADEMTLHDAAMTHYGQWWRRSLRSGYAYAEGMRLHGAPPERYGVRRVWSNWMWALLLPLLALGLAACVRAEWLALFLVYPIQTIRLALRGKRSARENGWHALFLVQGKFPEAVGQIKFMYNQLCGNTARLIEYK